MLFARLEHACTAILGNQSFEVSRQTSQITYEMIHATKDLNRVGFLKSI